MVFYLAIYAVLNLYTTYKVIKVDLEKFRKAIMKKLKLQGC